MDWAQGMQVLLQVGGIGVLAFLWIRSLEFLEKVRDHEEAFAHQILDLLAAKNSECTAALREHAVVMQQVLQVLKPRAA